MEDLSLVDGPLVVTVYVLAGLLIAAFLAARRRRRMDAKTRFHVARVFAVGFVGGAAFGGLAVWLLDDVFDIFGVSLSWTVRNACIVGFAFIGLAVTALIVGGAARRVLAAFSVVLTVLAVATTINIDFAEFPTVAAALGDTGIKPIEEPVPTATGAIDSWVAPADMPSIGKLNTATIPAVSAKFSPRDAEIYLPPAALTADPPPLPVVVALSGQPGAPADVFVSGNLKPVLDQIAAAHHGLAPIVVAADQLGVDNGNPMCVDGALGDSETYLTVDVPRWIEANLPASTDHSQWTIAGFSQGGTCSIQLGAGHPDVFGSLVDVSGELVPTLGTEAETIAQGFAGNAAAYEAATPAAILAAHAPYKGYVAYFASGSEDAQYSAYIDQIVPLAKTAGMTVAREVSPGTGHDWNTARWGFSRGFSVLYKQWKIE